MVWGRYEYFERISSTVDRAEIKVDRLAPDIKALQRQVDRLSLACQAMWELVRERTGRSEAQLEQKILEIDLRDGKADGKLSAPVLDCPSCGAKTNSHRSTCVMCGAAVPAPGNFAG